MDAVDYLVVDMVKLVEEMNEALGRYFITLEIVI